jgi:glycine dehydrogenase
MDRLNNPLKRAPHTIQAFTGEWDRPYSREQAAFPLPWIAVRGKYWPTVSRIDNVYGDKHPFCSCPDMELYL